MFWTWALCNQNKWNFSHRTQVFVNDVLGKVYQQSSIVAAVNVKVESTVTVMASLSAYSVTEPLGLTLGVNAH